MAGDYVRGGVACLVLLALWTIFAAYVADAGLPPNIVDLPGESRVRQGVIELVPEGWSFFTRNPRESDFAIYGLDDELGAWRSITLGPAGEARNLFGLSRRYRAQGLDFGSLAELVPASAWQVCDLGPAACLAGLEPYVVERGPAPGQMLCGPIGLAMQEPVPWAWSHSTPATVMPSRLVRLEVKCR